MEPHFFILKPVDDIMSDADFKATAREAQALFRDAELTNWLPMPLLTTPGSDCRIVDGIRITVQYDIQTDTYIRMCDVFTE